MTTLSKNGKSKRIALIGYSGHAYVVCDIFKSSGRMVSAYCEKKQKERNPYHLEYLGSERDKQTLQLLAKLDYFISIGDCQLRKEIFEFLIKTLSAPCNAVHASSVVSDSAKMGRGVMVSAKAVINAQSVIGDGVICNTGCIIEHECRVGNFSHIAPSATLCGNVRVGECSFIGANSVVRERVTIGNNVVIGAGSVIIKNVADNTIVVGNPGRFVHT